MIPIAATIAVPLRTDADGTIRVGESRVLLEIIIRAFQRGATPEGIAESFPTLALTDVYAVIAYYLGHRAEIDEYVARVEAESQQLRQQIEARQPDMSLVRERLLARMAEKKK